MVEIIAHRGYWLKSSEKNTLPAFKRAFSLNFGIETDIRDYRGTLVISHDIADGHSIKAETMFALYKSCGQSGTLALNIKADGLQDKLKDLLKKYDISKYFLFDMSFPEQLRYSIAKFCVFARQSEYESVPLLYRPAQGVWLDEFSRSWINSKIIRAHLKNKKTVCLVSPELHERDHEKVWKAYRNLSCEMSKSKLILCTDLPEKAKGFFNEKN